MASKKILIGSAVRQDPTVLEAHLKSLLSLEIPDDLEAHFVFVDDSDNFVTADLLYGILPGVQVLPTDRRPDDAIYNINSNSHNWSVETFDHLAKQKQKLLDYAVENHFEWLFLVDSDLLLERRTLKSALSLKKTLVSNVFWTQWNNADPNSLGPNVWLRNPYSQKGMGLEHGEFWKRLIDKKVTRVYGGGACHLVHRSSLERGVRYFPRLEGLPSDGMWQGEDRTFAILAFQLHQHQFADSWPDIFHAYHPDQRTDEVLQIASQTLSGPPQKYIKYGDLVSFTLEALEEDLLKDKTFTVRGRMGGLEMVPSLENLLLEMEVGTTAVHETTFPFYWPHFPKQKRVMRVHLVDAKPYYFPPVLEQRILEDAE